MAQPGIFTITQLNKYVKDRIQSDPVLNDVWVKGEISNYNSHYSGHMYITLKDNGGVLKAVMFKAYNIKLKFTPQTGMSVIARGNISVFERDGVYQLYITEMQPDGIGNLYKAYEQLKEKLQAEGLFDPRYKKPLPTLPRAIGLVTSPTGAAIRDMITVSRRRYPEISLILLPTAVQGESAAPQIAAAIDTFNRLNNVDVLIVGRGGGSIEELWAFNEEIVARSIFNSRIPVVSAVGHETDFTIADFVADLRAPTPSAAAELAVPVKQVLKDNISQLQARAVTGIRQCVTGSRTRLEKLGTEKIAGRMRERINQERQRNDSAWKNLTGSMSMINERLRSSLALSAARLDAMSPLAILGRGYSVAIRRDDKTLVSATAKTRPGDKLDIEVADGTIGCTVDSVKPENKGGNNGGAT